MNEIEEQMDNIIERIEKSAKRLKRIRQRDDDIIEERVVEFISEIDWMIPNLNRDILVKRLVRKLKKDKSLETRKFDS